MILYLLEFILKEKIIIILRLYNLIFNYKIINTFFQVTKLSKLIIDGIY